MNAHRQFIVNLLPTRELVKGEGDIFRYSNEVKSLGTRQKKDQLIKRFEWCND